MFSEPTYTEGSIEVICGCMFSGKTEELIRRMRRARIAGLPSILFKPLADSRYHTKNIVSHNANQMEGIAIRHSSELWTFLDGHRVVGVDEAQFFDPELPDHLGKLASSGVRVIVAGLDLDYLGRPFGPMPDILAIAEYVTKLQAICTVCGRPANRSYRKSDSSTLVLPGAEEMYEARCRKCYGAK